MQEIENITLEIMCQCLSSIVQLYIYVSAIIAMEYNIII